MSGNGPQILAAVGDNPLRAQTNAFVKKHSSSIIFKDPETLNSESEGADKELFDRFQLAQEIFYELHTLNPKVLVASVPRLQQAFNAYDLITYVGGRRQLVHLAFKDKVGSHPSLHNKIHRWMNWELGDYLSGDDDPPNPRIVVQSLRTFLREYGPEKFLLQEKWAKEIIRARAFPTNVLYDRKKATTEDKAFWQPVALLIDDLQEKVKNGRLLTESVVNLFFEDSSEKLRKLAGYLSNGLQDEPWIVERIKQVSKFIESAIQDGDNKIGGDGAYKYNESQRELDRQGKFTEEDKALIGLLDSELLPVYWDDPVFEKVKDKLQNRPFSEIRKLPSAQKILGYFGRNREKETLSKTIEDSFTLTQKSIQRKRQRKMQAEIESVPIPEVPPRSNPDDNAEAANLSESEWELLESLDYTKLKLLVARLRSGAETEKQEELFESIVHKSAGRFAKEVGTRFEPALKAIYKNQFSQNTDFAWHLGVGKRGETNSLLDWSDSVLKCCRERQVNNFLQILVKLWQDVTVGKKIGDGEPSPREKFNRPGVPEVRLPDPPLPEPPPPFDPADATVDAAAIVDALEAELIPEISPEQILRLENAIREAQSDPPKDKQLFKMKVNRILELHSLRLRVDGDDFKLTLTPNGKYDSYFQFTNAEGTKGGFKNAAIKIHPI